MSSRRPKAYICNANRRVRAVIHSPFQPPSWPSPYWSASWSGVMRRRSRNGQSVMCHCDDQRRRRGGGGWVGQGEMRARRRSLGLSQSALPLSFFTSHPPLLSPVAHDRLLSLHQGLTNLKMVLQADFCPFCVLITTHKVGKLRVCCAHMMLAMPPPVLRCR